MAEFVVKMVPVMLQHVIYAVRGTGRTTRYCRTKRDVTRDERMKQSSDAFPTKRKANAEIKRFATWLKISLMLPVLCDKGLSSPHRLGGVIDASASKASHCLDRIASRNGSKCEYPVRSNAPPPTSSAVDSSASRVTSSDTRRSPCSSQPSPSHPSPSQSFFDRKRSASASKSEDGFHPRVSS